MKTAISLSILLAAVLASSPARTAKEALTQFAYPVMPAADFNRFVAPAGAGAQLVWQDANKDATFVLPDGSIDAKEFSGADASKLIVRKEGKSYFAKSFEPVYASMVENLREEQVKRELTLTMVEREATDVKVRLKEMPEVTEAELAAYLGGLKKLMAAAPIMKTLYQKQIGTGPEEIAKAKTGDDRDLAGRYGHPWCLANTGPFCVAVPSLPKRKSGVMPEGVGCDQAGGIGSPFEIIRKDPSGKLVPVPYAAAWKDHLASAAAILREAAAIFEKIPREAKAAAYLKSLAASFESTQPYPYAGTDAAWTDFLASDSALYMRIGPDEVGGDGVGDPCESKARFHFGLGLRSRSARQITDRIRASADVFEKKFAELMADPKNYVARKVLVQLPVFLDVIYANGDDVGGPGGTPIGQTLPNWCGSDGKGECMRGTMIYVNKTTKAYNENIMKKYITPLFDPAVAGYFNAVKGLDSVVYHEIFHNLGPREKTKKPGSEEAYGDKLTTAAGESWASSIEELKAQTGSLYMATEYLKDAEAARKAGKLDSAGFDAALKAYREHVTYDIAWALRMILRAARGGSLLASRSPYSRLAAVQIGFLSEQGALAYDGAAKRWNVDYDKMPDAIVALAAKVGKLYAVSDVGEIEKTFLHYLTGEGLKLLHTDRLIEAAGSMPSVLFDYSVAGLE